MKSDPYSQNSANRRICDIINLMQTVLFLGAILLFSLPVSGPAQASDIRLERLNIIFEGNESASAYLRHCYDKGALAAKQFQQNYILTAEYLVREMVAEEPRLNKEQAFEALSRRQAEMAQPLNEFYKKNGCNSSQATAAKKHFIMFNEKPTDDMDAFLADIENQ